MNTATIIQQAEDDTLAEILTWVGEVIEGRGQSVSQMVVTVVLGCIPGVGQTLDAYNILRALYALTRDNDNPDHWIELVLSLIALVPVLGDALKNVFRMLRDGHSIGRILDALPRDVRGNIERWFRELDWPGYTRQLVDNVNQILDGMIDVLDTHCARWVMDRQGLERLIASLQALKVQAQQKIEQAMGSLQQSHQMAMAQPLPNTTASGRAGTRADTPQQAPPGSSAPVTSGQPGTGGRQPARQGTGPQGSRPRGTGPQSAGPRGGGPTPSGRGIPRNSGGTPTPRQGQAGARQRQNQRRRRKRHETGVSGEHIADYFFVRRQRRRSKVNENGRLYEMRQPGHQGIDHIWHGDRLPMKYRVSDTKATGKFQHPWLETPWRFFQALRYGLDVYMGTEDEGRLAGSLGKPTKTGRQLSHRWIAARINKAKVVDEHKSLIKKVEDWEGVNFKMTPSVSTTEDGTPERRLVKCPYDRSLITVVGPNHNLHDNRKGRVSPRCTKGQTSHQISTEFVIPTDILEG